METLHTKLKLNCTLELFSCFSINLSRCHVNIVAGWKFGLISCMNTTPTEFFTLIAGIIEFAIKFSFVKVNIKKVKFNWNSSISARMWDYEAIGHEMALKMLVVDGICEPTLNQIQEDPEDSNSLEENSQTTPAWKRQAHPHPGIPQHYFSVNALNDLQLASLPYSLVNREVLFKLIIKLDNAKQNRQLPAFERLKNGTIIITGHKIAEQIKHNIEIFLDFHNKLIPCCYMNETQLDNVITDDPSNPGGHVRCYYVAVENAIIEATFLTSRGRVTHRCDYNQTWLHGSVPYQELSNAPMNENKQ